MGIVSIRRLRLFIRVLAAVLVLTLLFSMPMGTLSALADIDDIAVSEDGNAAAIENEDQTGEEPPVQAAYNLEESDDTESGGEESGGEESGGTESGGEESGGTESGGEESGDTESGGAESGGEESGGEESGGTESGGTESGGTESGGTESGGTESDGTESGGEENGGEENGGTESGGEETPDEAIEEELPEEPQAQPQLAVATFAPFAAPYPATIDDCKLTGHKFPLNVPVTWVESPATTDFRKGKFEFEVWGGGEYLMTVELPVSGSTYTIPDIPVYISNGADEGLEPTYATPAGFYTVRLKKSSITGYTTTGTSSTEENDVDYAVITVGLSVNNNNLVWTASAPQPFTCTLTGLTEAAFNIVWTDSNNKEDKRPNYDDPQGFADLVELWYYDGIEYKPITKDNCGGLGFLSADALKPAVTRDGGSYSNWVCTFKNLPEEIEGETAQYFIKIADSTVLKEFYLTSYSGDDGYAPANGSVTNTYAGALTGTVQWFDAEHSEDENKTSLTRPPFSETNAPVALKVYKIGDSTPIPPSKYTLTWKDNEDGTWGYSIAGLPTYEDGGNGQNTYYVQVDGNKIDATNSVPGVHYSVGYDNKTTSTENDKCYDDGVILAILKADADFSIKKVWLDDNDKDGKRAAAIAEIELYLWRYPSNTSPAYAAAVMNDKTQLSYTLATGDGTIGYEKFTGGSGVKLPKYNEKGYEYKYFVTESLPANLGYRQVYIKDPGGTETPTGEGVYNDGELRNVRSEPVRVETTKLWKAQGVDDYKNAVVTLELQAKQSDGTWDTVETKTVTGFTTSVMSVSAVFDAVDKYDDEGKAIEFRVVETKVNTTGISVDDYSESGGAFEATYEVNGNTYDVTSEKAGDGWLVTNALSGKIDYTVKKVWAKNATPEDLTITLRQDGTGYAEIKVTGTTYTISALNESGVPSSEISGNVSEITGTVTDPDTSDVSTTWTFDMLELPAYNSSGKAYSYSIVETLISGTGIRWTDYNYSKTGNDVTATVTNYPTEPGEGTYKYIRVYKVWKDDNKLSQREPVTVRLVKVDAGGFITEITAKTCELSTGNNWESYIIVDGDTTGGYAVVEEKVGDRDASNIKVGDVWNAGTVPAEGLNPGYAYTISGDPAAVDHKSFTITNTRNGKVSVTVEKNWKDTDNDSGYRKAAFRVKLFKNGGQTAVDTKTWVMAEDNNGKKNQYTHTFDNLELFDANGVVNSYTVKEYIVTVSGSPETEDEDEISLTATAETTTTNYLASMTETSAESVVNNVLTQNTTVAFTNVATGKTSGTEFYVVWQDEDYRAMRPDASYTLYYNGGTEGAIIPYMYPHQMKTVSTESSGNPFYQKIIYSGMDEFDADGNKYTYYIGQSLEYIDIYSTEYYKSNNDIVEADEVSYDTNIHHHRPKEDAELSTATDSKTKLIPEGGAIVNSISDEVNIYGSKVWKNVDAGITKDELPAAIIYLWRYSDYDKKNERDAFDHTVTDLGDTDLSENKGSYRFEDSPGKLTDFAKYDEFGALYSYQLSEDIIYSDLVSGGSPVHVPKVIMVPDTTTFVLQNVFITNANRRSITVEKTWDVTGGAVAAGNEPAAIFRLYRGEYNPDITDPADPQPFSVSGIGAMPSIEASSAAAALKPTGTAVYLVDEQTLKRDASFVPWTNLPIFAPSGKSYVYFVCEVIDFVPGYAVTATGGGNGSKALTTDATDPDGKKMKVTVIGNTGLDVNSTSNATTVGYTNDFEDGTLAAKITGKKEWSDRNGIDGLRPGLTGTEGKQTCADITLKLSRFAEAQTGQSNSYSKNYLAGEITVAWAVSGNTWTYTIEPVAGVATFPKYAENGMPYTYTVTETYENGTVLKKNYKMADGEAEKSAKDVAHGGVIDMGTDVLKNELMGSVLVEKGWTDGYNSYDIRDTSVTVQLQRTLSPVTAGSAWVPFDSSPVVNSQDIIAPYLEAQAVKWINLPLTNVGGVDYVYRVIETHIGAEKLDLTGEEYGGEDHADAYALRYDLSKSTWVSNNFNYHITHSGNLTLSGTQATVSIANKLTGATSLTVTKTWGNDNNDEYGVRPDEVTLRLEWRYEGETGEASWKKLKQADGATDVTMKISGTSGTWSATFDNLPANDKNDSTKKIQYRAVETDGGAALDTTKTGESPLLDSYKMTGSVDDNTLSKTDITNELVKRTPITVKKTWNDGQIHTADKVRVGLYSDNFVTGDGTTGNSGTYLVESQDLVYDLVPANSYTRTWSDLPKYNTEQKEIIYYIKELSVNTSPIGGTGATTGGNTEDNEYHVNYYVGDNPVAETGKANANTAATAITAVNTKLTEATITKTWDDNSDRFKLRPAEITVTLERSFGGGSWTPVKYSDIAATAGNPPSGKTGADNVTLTLSSWSGNTKSGTIINLPAYTLAKDGGDAYEYRFVEATAPTGYAITNNTASNNATAITNSLIMSGTAYTVKKVWEDYGNQDAIRPAFINVELLYHNGTSFVSYSAPITQKLEESNSWTWNLGTLPKGKRYQIKEITALPTGYTPAVSPAEFTAGDSPATTEITVTNTYSPETVTHTAVKIWIGDDHVMVGVRPAIDMTLYRSYENASGQPVTEVLVTANQTGGLVEPAVFPDGAGTVTRTPGVTGNASHEKYEYTWENLPRYINVGTEAAPNKKPITYSAKETAHAGFTLGGYERKTLAPTVDAAGNSTTTIENTVLFVTMSGTKTWHDENNLFGARPDALELTVWYDDSSGNGWRKYNDDFDDCVIEWEKHSDNTWTYTVYELKKYADMTLTLMKYAVTETVPDFYKQTYPDPNTVTHQTGTQDSSSGEVTGADLANTIDAKTVPLVVEKTKDLGPASMEFSFKVMLSSSNTGIDNANWGTAYTGKYNVYTLTRDAGGTVISTDLDPSSPFTATGGIIKIKADQQFEITDIPDPYHYKVIELPHSDYDLDTDAADMKGSVTAGARTEVSVHNKARIEIEIENVTPNDTASSVGIGGQVVVGSTPNSYESDIGENKSDVAWKPSEYWTFGSTVSIYYTNFGETEKRATIIDFSLSEKETKPLSAMEFSNAAEKAALLAKYPNAEVSMLNGVVMLDFGNLPDEMPRKTRVLVDFLPTLAVDNITQNNQGGTVKVENGAESTDADGVPAYGGTPYNATTVYGTAATGYRLDTTQVLVRNLNDLGGLISAPVALSVASNGTFSARIPTVINNGITTYVDISGTVTLIKDASGNVTSAVFTLNELPVPLQFDLLFVPVTDNNNYYNNSGNRRNNRNGWYGDGTTNPETVIPVEEELKPDVPQAEDETDYIGMKKASPQTSDDTPVSGIAALAVLTAIGAFLSRKKTGGKIK